MTTSIDRTVAPQLDEGTGFSARQRVALTVLCLTIMLISLDQSVLNIAIPTLVKDLHPSNSGLEWIADSYVLTQAVFLLLGGALGDRYGRRRMFIIGSAGFGGGSLMCALVHSTWLLVAARAITGLGAAGLVPATMALIISGFEGRRRARAIGIWAGVGGIGSTAGPVFGGFLLDHFWWGSVFLINVPVAIGAMVGARAFMQESKAEAPPPLDPVGALLSAGGIALLTYALILAPSKHWGSATVLGTIAVSAVILTGFLVWDGRREHPLLDLGLFRNRTFASGIAAMCVLFFAMFGTSFLLSQFIQFVERASVLGVGLRFLPTAAGSMIASNLSARLTHRFNTRAVLLAGMSLVMVGLAILATLSVSSGYLPIGIAFGCMGVGMGLSIAPASVAVVSALPAEKIGAGSGLRSMVQFLGGAFGVAIIGSLATGHYTARVNAAYAGPLRAVPPQLRGGISNQIGDAFLTSKHLSGQLAAKVTEVTNSAFVAGMRLAAIIALSVSLVAVIAVAAYIPRDVELTDEEAKLSAAG